MILVGNQRGGAKDLALHLMKDENERVVVHEIRGFVSDDLASAFQESYAMSRATKCKQHLYSLSLNPPKDAKVSSVDFESAVDRAERALGLQGQPRAIVFHEKTGSDGQVRRHAHAVWSRVDSENMKAVQLSYSKSKLQDVARSLYREYGWSMPRGFVRHQERNPRNYSLSEWQQAKRAEKNPEKLKAMFQDAWSTTDGKVAFSHALEERGYVLAQGDRRGAVAVDYKGEAYSISRYVGVKAKQVREKLGDLSSLPNVSTAQAKAAGDLRDRLCELRQEELRRQAEECKRQRVVAEGLRLRQEQERRMLRQVQDERAKAEAVLRAGKIRRGWRGLIDWITGERKRALAEKQRAEVFVRARFVEERRFIEERQRAQQEAMHERARANDCQREQTIKELNSDIEALEDKPAQLREDAKEAYVRQKRIKASRPKRRTRARDGPAPKL